MKEEAYTLPVYKTEDYTIFKKLNGNRELNQNQIKRLVKAIELDSEFTKYNPISLNEDMEVIDGQHRIAAFTNYSKAGKGTYPVYYTVNPGLTLSTARRMNAGARPWTPIDYAQAYAYEGNENYQIYLDYIEEFGMSHQATISALTQNLSAAKTSHFRNGLFLVTDKKVGKKLLEQLVDYKSSFPNGWMKESFGVAMISLMLNKRFDHSRMVEQLSKNSEGLNNIPNRRREMHAALNMIYNWKRKDMVDLLTK